MIKATILMLTLSFQSLFGLEKMEEQFLIHYGNPNAPLKVTEYMSFSCPHCVKIFEDFPKIKKDFIDTDMIYFTFHPVPKDYTTLRALLCLEILSEREKHIFLEALFEYLELEPENSEQLCEVMQDFLSCFDKEKLPLNDSTYLQKSSLIEKAFLFISQENQVKALPTEEINGFLFEKDIPSYAFFKEAVQVVLEGEK